MECKASLSSAAHITSSSLSCHIYSRHQSLGCTRVMMIISTRGAPPLPHSFILLAWTSSAWIKPAFAAPSGDHCCDSGSLHADEWGGGENINPLLMCFFFFFFLSLPPCNTTLILWMVSQSCFLPPPTMMRGAFAVCTQPTNMTAPLLFHRARLQNVIFFAFLWLLQVNSSLKNEGFFFAPFCFGLLFCISDSSA